MKGTAKTFERKALQTPHASRNLFGKSKKTQELSGPGTGKRDRMLSESGIQMHRLKRKGIGMFRTAFQ